MAGSLPRNVTVEWTRRSEKEAADAVSKALRANMAAAGDVVKKSVQDMLSGPSPAPPGAPPGDAPGKKPDLRSSIMRRAFGGKNPGFIVIPRDAKHKEQLGRLQKGFTGRDSLGRAYHQAPRPFTGRALDRVKDEVLRLVSRG